MYWSVVGAFVSAEYLAGWLVDWLPFYWELKTTFLLFLSLPQTQGSNFIYTQYLQPFFAKNESHIDSGIITMQANVLSFVQTRLAMVWEFVWGVINKTPATGQPSAAGGSPQQASAPSLMGLWQTYGPTLVSALQPAAKPSAAPPTPGLATASTTSVDMPAAGQRSSHTEAVDPSAPPFPVPQHA